MRLGTLLKTLCNIGSFWRHGRARWPRALRPLHGFPAAAYPVANASASIREFWQRGEALLLTGRIAVRWMERKADMPTQILTAEIMAAAIDGYEFQKTRIDTKIAELRAMLSGGPAPPVTLEPKKRKRRKMSGAGRARIAEAQRKRWAKIRGESESSATPEPPKPKRRISKAGMARIIAATKARWAKVRAAKAQQEKAARKAARKKAAGKKAAGKAPPARAAKRRAPVKKAAAKTTPAPAQAVPEANAQ